MSKKAPMRHYTSTDWETWPAENSRVELIDGEMIVSPEPSIRHERIVARLAHQLLDAVRISGGEAFLGHAAVRFSNGTVVVPDLIWIAESRRGILSKQYVEGAPDLVIEVLSPSNRKHDLEVKRRLYERECVREFWIVDPEGDDLALLDLHQTGYRKRRIESIDTVRSAALPEFTIDLGRLFRE